MSILLKQKKIGFIGTGNLAQSIIKGLISSNLIKPEQIIASSRTENRLKKVQEKFGIQIRETNEQVVDDADIIILGMKPQDFQEAVESIASSFETHHIVISLAAGISVDTLSKMIFQCPSIVRVLCNIPVKIGQGMIGYQLKGNLPNVGEQVQALFETLGQVVEIDNDEAMSAFCVASSAGVGFVIEFMQYFQDWIEGYGFEPATARLIAAQTFLGASALARDNNQIQLFEIINQIASKKGVTEAGLNSMRETDLERALRVSFEKAYLRDRELGI